MLHSYNLFHHYVARKMVVVVFATEMRPLRGLVGFLIMNLLSSVAAISLDLNKLYVKLVDNISLRNFVKTFADSVVKKKRSLPPINGFLDYILKNNDFD